MTTFTALTDGSYTGGLVWLYRFGAEVEPTGETQPSETHEDVADEWYTVRFPHGVDGTSLLNDCDCVISFSENPQ